MLELVWIVIAAIVVLLLVVRILRVKQFIVY
jgi:hypothetical protein